MDHGIADKRSAQVMERSVNELPKVKRHQEGEPVRVVPDLRESDPSDPTCEGEPTTTTTDCIPRLGAT